MSESEDLFDKIRETADIEEVAIDLLDLPHKRIGNRISVLCPAHGDKRFGSAYLYKSANKMKCFSCGAKLDPVDLIRKTDNCSVYDAAKKLADFYGLTISKTTKQKPKPSFKINEVDLNMIGINDLVSLKELFKEDRSSFWMYLLASAIKEEAKAKRLSSVQTSAPTEVKQLARERVKKISQFIKTVSSARNTLPEDAELKIEFKE